ncbi:MAG: IS1634 family transposase [Bacteroidetes bacterium]|nr:IS1634 family transposase [Bacteroidota bacterium]
MDLSELHLDWGSSRYKGKVYRSYSLARALWVDGKNKKETVIKLGKLSDAEVAKWRSLLKALKDPNCILTSFDDICVEKHYSYLDIAIANAIWDEWGLDSVFSKNGKRHVSIATVARILTINRCVDPVAKSKTPEWFQDTALPWMLDINPTEINPSRIFRELAIIEKHKDQICKYLFKQLSQSDSMSMKSLFYDLSSTSFEGSKCKLMKWGHCKGGYENHVVLALVVNKKGLPFYWEVLPGCTADSTTINWLLESLKNKFNIKEFREITFVFDRGMVSDDNLTLLEDEEIKYISAMDKNQMESITDLDFTKFTDLDPEKVDKQAGKLPEFNKINDNTYCREIKVNGKRRYILCFNPQLFKDQRKAREQALANFRTFVKNLNFELLGAKKSRQKKATYAKFEKRLKKMKLNGFVDVTLTIKHVYSKGNGSKHKIRTYHGKVVVNHKAMRLSIKRDGFWLLVTSHSEKENQEFKITTEEAITPYREKEIIEEAFRDIKSFVMIEPVFVWTEDHVKAHYTICVLTYLINRTLTLRLHENKGNQSQDVVAHQKLFKETSQCMLDYIEVKNIQQKKISLTKPTTKQKELLQRVGLPKLTNRKIVKKANSD